MGAHERHTWTPGDIKYLREHRKDMTDRQIGNYIGVSESAVCNRRYKLCISVKNNKKHYRWTPDDIKYLHEHHEDMTPGEMGRHLGRSEKSVYQKAHNLGISCHCGESINHKYTIQEDQYIIDHYVEDGGPDVAEHLGITAIKIHSRVFALRKVLGKMPKSIARARVEDGDIDRNIAEADARIAAKIAELPHMERPDRGAITRVPLPQEDIEVVPSADAIMVAISRLKGKKLHDFRVRYRLYMARLRRACSTGMPIVSPGKEFKSIAGE